MITFFAERAMRDRHRYCTYDLPQGHPQSNVAADFCVVVFMPALKLAGACANVSLVPGRLLLGAAYFVALRCLTPASHSAASNPTVVASGKNKLMFSLCASFLKHCIMLLAEHRVYVSFSYCSMCYGIV